METNQWAGEQSPGECNRFSWGYWRGTLNCVPRCHHLNQNEKAKPGAIHKKGTTTLASGRQFLHTPTSFFWVLSTLTPAWSHFSVEIESKNGLTLKYRLSTSVTHQNHRWTFKNTHLWAPPLRSLINSLRVGLSSQDSQRAFPVILSCSQGCEPLHQESARFIYIHVSIAFNTK